MFSNKEKVSMFVVERGRELFLGKGISPSSATPALLYFHITNFIVTHWSLRWSRPTSFSYKFTVGESMCLIYNRHKISGISFTHFVVSAFPFTSFAFCRGVICTQKTSLIRLRRLSGKSLQQKFPNVNKQVKENNRVKYGGFSSQIQTYRNIDKGRGWI